MPISLFDLVWGSLIVIGLPIAVIWLNRRRYPAGWWLLGAFVAVLVVGNVIEQIVS